VQGRPVAKRSEHKQTTGGRKSVLRRHKPTGTATEEVAYRVAGPAPEAGPDDRTIPVPLVRAGREVPGLPTLQQSRENLARALVTLPWEGLSLSKGDPAIPTTMYAG
jgi:nicotinate phosphoribosyltransferase